MADQDIEQMLRQSLDPDEEGPCFMMRLQSLSLLLRIIRSKSSTAVSGFGACVEAFKCARRSRERELVWERMLKLLDCSIEAVEQHDWLAALVEMNLDTPNGADEGEM